MIWAIPGFLGLPSDWSFFGLNPIIGVDWQAIPWKSLPDWGTQFNQRIGSHHDHPSVLMGYSFGGRLALHALLDNPKQWKAAIIISANPGLSDPHEKINRIEHDRQWATRFETEEWTSLIKAWNGQEIFSNDPFKFQRKEQDYQRNQLVQALLQGSLGAQEDLRQQIKDLKIPFLWITGSEDLKYCQIARTLSFSNPHSRWEKIPSSGHRAPWVQPQIFETLVHQFLFEIDLLHHSPLSLRRVEKNPLL
jgi:2-succinyl-6-hydroxy-2,4-cyclohexadiene-1-carboxylate synthase